MIWNSRIDSSEKANGMRLPPRFSPKKVLFASTPSIWTFVCDGRWPAIENWPPVVVSGVGLTSPEMLMKSVKSRPSAGRLSICSSLTVVFTPAFVGSTRAASALTRTVESVTADACSVKLSGVAEPTTTRTSGRLAGCWPIRRASRR